MRFKSAAMICGLIAAAGAAMLGACDSGGGPAGVAAPGASGAAAESAAEVSSLERPFSLIDQQGKPVTDRDFHGRWLLVFFGFTHCPDVCPLTLTQVKAALDSLREEAQRLQVLFITVDPERDTPQAMADYLSGFGGKFIGLTGSKEQIAAATTTFGTYAAKQGESDAGAYLMDHSASLYLLDPNGRLNRQFSSQTQPAQLADSLRKILAAQLVPGRQTGKTPQG